MRTLLALALVAASLVGVGEATACARDPLVTVGAPAHPAPGAYATLDCGAAPGVPVVRVEWTTPGTPAPCVAVPPVFVLGGLLPGTGATHCAPAGGGGPQSAETPWNMPLPDRGAEACTLDGACAGLSVAYANKKCAELYPLSLTLPMGASVKLLCVVKSP